MWFLLREVSSSSGCLGWATLFLWHTLSLPLIIMNLNVCEIKIANSISDVLVLVFRILRPIKLKPEI